MQGGGDPFSGLDDSFGSDGLTSEECKKADSSTGQTTHRVSRGIHKKGHSVSRNLKSDGHVDTMQPINCSIPNPLPFLPAVVYLLWKFDMWLGKGRKHLPGWSEELANQDIMASGSNSQQHRPPRGGCSLPSTEKSNVRPDGPPQHSGREQDQ